MPEGPEVRTVVDKLRDQLVGQSLITISIGERAKIKGHEQCSLPILITEMRSYGKKMIITLEGGLHIVISVLMVGRLQWTEGKHSHVEFILQSTDGSTKSLYYDDYRYMGNILFLTSQELEIYLGKLGPDLLAHALNEETWISPEEWTKIFKLKKYQNRMIADVLVEPAAITGIGNYLRAEILYYARISPIRQVKSLTIEEWELLRQWSHKIILESYSCGGFTLKDFISPDGSKGMYPAVVYGRTQDPQGNKVEKMKLKGRTIHYVPEMQV